MFRDQALKNQTWPMDFWLLGLMTSLVVLGLTMVYSSSVAIAEMRFDNSLSYFYRQVFALGLGLGLAFIVFKVPLVFWENHRGKFFLFALLMLVAVLILGREINGSKRWLPLVIMNFQPSEFMKLAVVIFMAGYLDRHVSAVQVSFKAVLRLALPFGLMSFLLLLQPDYGSTLVIAVIITGMLLIAGSPLRYFLMTVVPIISILSVLVVTSDYRMERISSFLDPWQDPFGSGYQLTQALIAAGSGNWVGNGIGGSVQKMLYLPDAHTDFLFSIYAEEFGFVGVVFLLTLYLAILYRLFIIGRRAIQANHFFGAMIAYGVGIWFILQAGINIGVNLGAFPTKGLTLPFMSYGGSSLLLFCIALALVFRVDYETRFRPRPAKEKSKEDRDDNDKATPEYTKKRKPRVNKTSFESRPKIKTRSTSRAR